VQAKDRSTNQKVKMALEKRGNGYYYYEKKRIGNRVISPYSGGGEIARFMQLLDQRNREEAWLEKETKRRSFEAEKHRQYEIDQAITAFCDQAEALADAIFLINGFHKHSRTWRRKAK
jgi:hypothetical protein